MAGFDSRVCSGFIGLGYDFFPFQSFNQMGQLIIPNSVNYPTHVKEGVGRVVQAPIWEAMYRTMSVLDDPQWNVYSAGIGFSGRTVNIVIFKSLGSVRNVQEAHQWMVSYSTVVARTIRQFAGQQYLIDPAWVAAANTALVNLPASEKQNDPAKGGKVGGGQGSQGSQGKQGSPLPIVSDIEGDPALVATFVPWLMMGLKSVLGLLEKYAPKPEVRTTVWWFPPSTQQMTLDYRQHFYPMHTDYMYDGAIRSLAGIWDYRNFRFHYSANVDWTKWLWRMPHEPWQWCRAFNPVGNCGGPGLSPDGEELVGMVDPAPGFVPPDDATDGVEWNSAMELAGRGAEG